MRTEDKIDADLRKLYKEREQARIKHAKENIIGRSFAIPETGIYHFAFDADGKNVQVITVSEYSASMEIIDLPYKHDVFQHPIEKSVFQEAKKRLNDKFDKIINNTKEGEVE